MELSPEGEQGAFNFAFRYLERLDEIEYGINIAFAKRDYRNLFTFIELFWLNLQEWFNPTEIELHDKLRAETYRVNLDIEKRFSIGNKNIPLTYLECYINRIKELKKIIHKKGLRMPKKDDPSNAMGGRHF